MAQASRIAAAITVLTIVATGVLPEPVMVSSMGFMAYNLFSSV